MNPFTDLYVLPSYGRKEALIKWEIPFEYELGNFIIQKSGNGITHWKTIGSDVAIKEWVDDDFVVPNRHQETHYRVILQMGGKRYDSTSVATFDKLRRREYGLLRSMMIQENSRMNNEGNGIGVAIFKQKITGEPCKCVDADTGQDTGSSLCTDCYGTGILGGFDDHIHTFVELQNQKSKITYSKQGLKADDTEVVQIRVVAYPELRRGDIIVNPRTDHRWVVNNIDPAKFKGIVPFIYTLQTSLLDRKDIRYQIPTSQILDDHK